MALWNDLRNAHKPSLIAHAFSFYCSISDVKEEDVEMETTPPPTETGDSNEGSDIQIARRQSDQNGSYDNFVELLQKEKEEEEADDDDVGKKE